VNSSFKQQLKAKAHHLKPIILIGAKGLTQAVLDETSIALTTHELIKVKLYDLDKQARLELIEALCQQLTATLVQRIGNTAIIYRQNDNT
tara:strand:- start:2072 stop:2341 length:270 start_codon:yes stop_codon:yes gene_type:complete